MSKKPPEFRAALLLVGRDSYVGLRDSDSRQKRGASLTALDDEYRLVVDTISFVDLPQTIVIL